MNVYYHEAGDLNHHYWWQAFLSLSPTGASLSWRGSGVLFRSRTCAPLSIPTNYFILVERGREKREGCVDALSNSLTTLIPLHAVILFIRLESSISTLTPSGGCGL